MQILCCITYQWRFILSSRIFILTSPVCFTVTKFLSATSIYLSISSNDTSTKSEISGFVWQVAPDSKIQLVSCKLSPEYLLGIYALEDICDIDVYFLFDYFYFSLFSDVLFIFVDLYAWVLWISAFQFNLFSKVSGFRPFEMKLSSNPHMTHILVFRPIRSVCLL